MNRRKKVPNTVSLDFEELREMPSSREVGYWLVEQELEPRSGFNVKRISKSEHDKRFYLQLTGEEMVEQFMVAIGQEGRKWKEEKTGQVRWIKARRD